MPTNPPAEGAVAATVHMVRRAEIESVRSYFAPGARVLELGGGDGYQASVLASWGVRVDSVDVSDSEHKAEWFDVRTYDGRTLPFEDGQFDVVFSSNVLEHIRDLAPTFDELKRVTKKDALHIHVLPSPTWRLWTILAHYPALILRFPDLFARFVLRRRAPSESSHRAPGARRRFWRSVRHAVMPAAHGEYSSAFAELWYYSVRRWLREFRHHVFAVVGQYPASVFYTGYKLLPKMSLNTRRQLAAFSGSSCNVFVLRSASVEGAFRDAPTE